MKILVFGATGKTGDALVKQALSKGHEVTAFMHSAAEYEQTGVHVMEGDALDAAKVEEAVVGQEAVLDALGGSTPYKQTGLEQKSVRNIVEAMRKHGVRRLVAISALGVRESKANAGFIYENLLMPTFLRGAIKDKAEMEEHLETSGVDWVIVRPAALTDGARTGTVKTFLSEVDGTAHKISREDVAAFILEQISSDAHLREAVTIASE